MRLFLLMLLLFSPFSMARTATLDLCAEPWAPFIYPDQQGRAQGIASDLIRAGGERLGYRIRIIFMSAEACYKLIHAGKADIMGFALAKNSPKAWLQTKEPLVYWVLRAWVANDSPLQDYTSLGQFTGQRVAFVNVYDYPAAIRQKTDWQRVSSVDSVMSVRLLAARRVDVIFEDRLAIETADPGVDAKVRGLSPVVAGVAQPFTMRPALQALRDELDLLSQQWQKQGRLDAFYQQHFKSSFAEVKANEARP